MIDLVNGETSLVDFGAATLLKKNHYTDFQGIYLFKEFYFRERIYLILYLNFMILYVPRRY